MTTGGPSGIASNGTVVPDRQGEVNAQHRPSAKSENDKGTGSKVLLTDLETSAEQMLHHLH